MIEFSIVIVIGILFLIYTTTDFNNKQMNEQKMEQQRIKLKQYENMRYFQLTSNLVLDLETLIYRNIEIDSGSSILNLSYMFNNDLTQTCTYSRHDRYGTIKVIDKGIIDREALYKSTFLDYKGDVMDIEEVFRWGYFDFKDKNKGEKNFETYFNYFKEKHSFNTHDWDSVTIERIKIARKNLDNFILTYNK